MVQQKGVFIDYAFVWAVRALWQGLRLGCLAFVSEAFVPLVNLSRKVSGDHNKNNIVDDDKINNEPKNSSCRFNIRILCNIETT